VLADLDVTTNLHKITASTLLISGTYDRYRGGDEMVRPFLDKIKHVQWVNFDNSSHMPSYEEPERYLKVVDDFLSPVLGS
jgi:pimeloyl-ACP methyl ester carboxylesterase